MTDAERDLLLALVVVVRRFANPHEAKTVDKFAEEVVAERVERAVEKAYARNLGVLGRACRAASARYVRGQYHDRRMDRHGFIALGDERKWDILDFRIVSLRLEPAQAG